MNNFLFQSYIYCSSHKKMGKSWCSLRGCWAWPWTSTGKRRIQLMELGIFATNPMTSEHTARRVKLSRNFWMWNQSSPLWPENVFLILTLNMNILKFFKFPGIFYAKFLFLICGIAVILDSRASLVCKGRRVLTADLILQRA